MSRILIIIRNNKTRAFIRDLIVENGYSAEATTDFAFGLVKFQMQKFDVVIGDFGIPTSLSLQFLTLLSSTSARQGYPMPPVIVLGHHMTEPTIRKAQYGGAFRCLQLPIQGVELLATVNEALQINMPQICNKDDSRNG